MKLVWIIAKEIAVILTSNFTPGKWEDKRDSLVWIDGRSRPPQPHILPHIVEPFYDRIVSIAYLKPDENGDRLFKHETTGVLVSWSQVLTTLNPYRELSMQTDSLRQMRVKIFYGRQFNKTVHFLRYNDLNNNYYEYRIMCARQIIPVPSNKIRPIDLRHGVNSPLHDLMVLRVDRELYDGLPYLLGFPKFKLYLDSDFSRHTCSGVSNWKECNLFGTTPKLTKLARLGEKLSETDMVLVSIAHLNDEHIFENRYLEKTELTHKEKFIADCDEWLPREWGHFICLRNFWKFEGVGSSAMLFKNDTVFSLGAFAIWKGNYDEDHYFNHDNGILVFTDVRPYTYLLTQTCTTSDQQLRPP